MGDSIELRPAIVDKRTEFGHWKIDTVIGKKTKNESCVLTLIEKLTKNYIALKIKGKDANSVMEGIATLKKSTKTIFLKFSKQ